MITKMCTGRLCNREKKPVTEFNKQSASKDGLQNHCRDCTKEYNDKNKEKISNQRKEAHKKCPWKVIFNGINQRCNNPKDKNYKNYGGRGIKNHLTLEDVKFLYIKYKAYLMKKPSIDRKDNDGNYTIENCEFIELKENSGKDKRKPILQYDLNNKFIREFKSMREVQRIFKIDHSSISKCCKGNYNHAGGFKWRCKT